MPYKQLSSPTEAICDICGETKKGENYNDLIALGWGSWTPPSKNPFNEPQALCPSCFQAIIQYAYSRKG